MTDTDTRKEVDAFVSLPRAERRAKFAELSHPVKLRARKIIEARRGIAYRGQGGMIVRTQEEYVKKLLDMQEKKDVLLPQRIEALGAKMVEFKRQLQENYGDEALAEVENLLEDAAAPKKGKK